MDRSYFVERPSTLYNVAKTTFSKVLEHLSGSDLGWRTMVQIYEREQARERLWADH